MREGWIEKRFDEVFSLQMGKTPDRKNLSLFEGNNVWVSIKDLEDKFISSSKECISDEAASNINIVKRGTVIMSFKLTIGKCAIAANDLYTNEAIMAFNVNEGYEIEPNFLYYYLQGYKWKGLNNAVMGLTLNKSTISKHKISIPPISKQHSIASELDMITELISKYDEQLKELDKLSQSIFYEMFGDPVENEKGWEVKKLDEICDKITDGTHFSPPNDSEGDYMYVTAKNIKKEGVIFDDITYIDKETHKSIYSRCNPEYGDVLYIKDGVTTGVATINTIREEFSLLSSVALLKPNNSIINYYLKYVLNMPTMYNNIRLNMGGVAITRLTLIKINNIIIPLPPLPLQQSFARKIEAIEAIKAKVKEAKKEAETLLAARMQYWFE